jgi:hypothetical protein
MDKTALVAPDVAAGRELIEALGTAGLRVEAAFWWLEDNEWRLILATPLVRERGPLFVDSRVRDVVESANLPRELFDSVEVVSPSAGVVTMLSLGGEEHIPKDRLVLNESMNSIYIAGAYFYKFQPKSFDRAS